MGREYNHLLSHRGVGEEIMKSKWLIACLMILILAALACTAPGASTPTLEVQSTPQLIVVTATQPAATSGPVVRPSPTSQPETAIPSAAAPSFSHSITFAEKADASVGTRSFHEGVTRIYALWQYSNMTAGLTVRRDWYQDGKSWITKEEPWNFDKYGANGMVTDISIYDTQNGLPGGHYELRLYIDNMPQFTASDDVSLRSFDIIKGADGGN
jgi:hypothetical protein